MSMCISTCLKCLISGAESAKFGFLLLNIKLLKQRIIAVQLICNMCVMVRTEWMVRAMKVYERLGMYGIGGSHMQQSVMV